MIITALTVVVMAIGIMGYVSFGSTVQSLIIYNLPSREPLSIASKVFQIISICGSFVLLI